jgi:hypothetical protein
MKGTTMFKSIILAAATIAASATIASTAGNYMSPLPLNQERGTEIQLGLIVAEGNGTVEIREFHNGKVGKLLGSEGVQASGNPVFDVEITSTLSDVIAILNVDGKVVDTQEFNFDQRN